MSFYSRKSVQAPPPDQTLAPDQQTRWDVIVGLIALGVIVLDQITKSIVLGYFRGPREYDIVHVVGNILTIEYTENKGAAFSSFTQSPLLLGFLILIAISVIGWLYWSTRDRNNPWLKATFGLIIGGAIGNLLDRVQHGYVVDFIHFQLPAINFNFAVFNVADAGISVGVVLLAIIFWLLPRTTNEGEATTPDDSTTNSTAKPSTSNGTPLATVKAATSLTRATATATANKSLVQPTIARPIASASRKRKRR